jgi:ATP adenylyltransferase
MWSPWRSRYIESFNRKPPAGRKKKSASLFTRALRSRDDDRNLILWRGKYCFVIMNRFPYNSGHLLIVPNREAASFEDLRPEESAEIMEVSRRAKRALDRVMHPHGYNFGANLGRVSGAGIEAHLHFHLVPRWNGDTNFMPVLTDTKVISEDIVRTMKKLRRHF